MPRFYFNLRYGPEPAQVAVDPESDDLPDLGVAREHALTAARDTIAKTRISIVRDWYTCSVEIEDEERHPLLEVPFSDTLPDGGDDG